MEQPSCTEIQSGPRWPTGMDLDVPIYRFHSFKYMPQLLGGTLTLVLPSCWDDPYENLAAYSAVTFLQNGKWEHVMLNTRMLPVFAQCWGSLEESDALWRIYSRMPRDPKARDEVTEDEGVRIRTTPRKLLNAVASRLGNTRSGNCFIAPVKYLDHQALLQEMTNRIAGDRDAGFCSVVGNANFLLLKRDAFCHEHEMRLIYVDKNREFGNRVECPVDANTLIEEIMLDPRLLPDQDAARIKKLKDDGFRGKINKSALYSMVVLNVVLDNKPIDVSSCNATPS